jgi:methionine-S-sulfoxide reductase
MPNLMRISWAILVIIAIGIAAWPPKGESEGPTSGKRPPASSRDPIPTAPGGTADARATRPVPSTPEKTETAIFAAGCFWCTEFAFEQLDGVINVESGYCGGTRASAHYDMVHLGKTGHAEAIRVTYDPEKVSYNDLLNVFFDAHDPTQLNRQGEDKGRQYRSAIFFANEEQQKQAKAKIADLDAKKVYKRRIVTKLEPLKEFFPAEDYHQNFARNHPFQPYIRLHAVPRAAAVRSRYPDLIRKEE